MNETHFGDNLKWRVPDEAFGKSPIFGTSKPTSVAEAELYVPQIAEGADLPRNIKVDLTTDLESCLLGCGCVSLVAMFISLNIAVNGCSDKHGHQTIAPVPDLKYAAAAFLVICAASFLSRFFTDNYYIVNVERRKIFYHYKFFWSETVTEFLSPENIWTLTVRATHQHNKSSSWWNHQLVAIDAEGKIIPLSDEKQDSLSEYNARAELIAAILGCNYCKCPSEGMIALDTSEKKIYFFKHV